MRLRYWAGGGWLIRRGSLTLLLGATVPLASVEALWQSPSDDSDFSSALQELLSAIGANWADLPPFALLLADGRMVHLAVRAGASVQLETVAGTRLVRGDGVVTWREESLDQVISWSARLAPAPDAPDLSPLAGVPLDGLPLIAGVVRAGRVSWAEGTTEAPSEIPAVEDKELAPATVNQPKADAESVLPAPVGRITQVEQMDSQIDSAPGELTRLGGFAATESSATEVADDVPDPGLRRTDPADPVDGDIHPTTFYKQLWGGGLTVTDVPKAAASDDPAADCDDPGVGIPTGANGGPGTPAMPATPAPGAPTGVTMASISAPAALNAGWASPAPDDPDKLDDDHDGHTRFGPTSRPPADPTLISPPGTADQSQAWAGVFGGGPSEPVGPTGLASGLSAAEAAGAPVSARMIGSPADVDDDHDGNTRLGPTSPLSAPTPIGQAADQAQSNSVAPATSSIQAGAPACQPADDPQPPFNQADAPRVLARRCGGCGVLNPTRRVACRACDLPLTGDPQSFPRPVLGRLRLPNGQMVDLDHPLVIGRRPAAARFSRSEQPQLVMINDQHISGTHLKIDLEDWTVLVTNLGRNGTLLRRIGQADRRIGHGEQILAEVGDRLDLSDQQIVEIVELS
ncbi:MAG: FHA domain-containing protein [Propionibacteriaceae bacterium]|jgi:hypothetical protein|nr:FHA domain-containing protein [Propionibacteriaceae bacterium]